MIACVLTTDFAVAVERQHNPALGDTPLVLIRPTGHRAKVYAACDVARSMGVKPGMFTNRAAALCPEAYFVSASPSLYRREAHKLLETLLTFTDRIEIEPTHMLTLWLDLGKLPSGEAHQIGSKVLQTVLEKTPFRPSVGIADGKFTSRIAATKARCNSVALVSAGNEAAFLAAFSIQNLALGKELSRQFDLLGIDTLGQFAILPRGAVIERFGKVGGILHRLAHGQDTRTIARYIPPRKEHTAHHFDSPIEDRTIIQSVFTQLTCKLATHLNEQGLAVSDLTLVIHCENKRLVETSQRLRQPITGPLSLLRAVDRLFGLLTLCTDITGIEIHLDNLQPLAPQQLDFFGQLMGTTYTVPELVKHLQPRHTDEPFRTITLSQQRSHIPERRFRVESVDVA